MGESELECDRHRPAGAREKLERLPPGRSSVVRDGAGHDHPLARGSPWIRGFDAAEGWAVQSGAGTGSGRICGLLRHVASSPQGYAVSTALAYAGDRDTS